MSLETTQVLQIIIIVAISVAASYIFQNTQTSVLINNVCIYRYIVYGITIVFSYVCVSRYNKYIAFVLTLALSVLALFSLERGFMEMFPTFVPLFATLMGIVTVLLVPEARGRGFFEFLMVLILPSLLAESKVIDFRYFIATSKCVTSYEIFTVTIAVIAGYFYLRYAALGNLERRNFLSKGEMKTNVSVISQWTNLISGIIITGAAGTVIFLAIVTPVVAEAFQPIFKDQPLYMFAFAGCIGIVVVIILVAFQIQTRYAKETSGKDADEKTQESLRNLNKRLYLHIEL